jgi:hypothetical protein
MLSAIPFIVPVNPGARQAIQAGTTATQISDITRHHIKSICIWNEYLSTDKALQQHIIVPINSTYYHTLHNCIMGYANTTTLQILMHLYTTYGNITPTNLIKK